MNYPEAILYSVTAISCITGAIKVFAITRKKNDNPGSNPGHELRKVKDCEVLHETLKEDLKEIKADTKETAKSVQQIALDIAKLNRG